MARKVQSPGSTGLRQGTQQYAEPEQSADKRGDDDEAHRARPIRRHMKLSLHFWSAIPGRWVCTTIGHELAKCAVSGDFSWICPRFWVARRQGRKVRPPGLCPILKCSTPWARHSAT